MDLLKINENHCGSDINNDMYEHINSFCDKLHTDLYFVLILTIENCSSIIFILLCNTIIITGLSILFKNKYYLGIHECNYWLRDGVT